MMKSLKICIFRARLEDMERIKVADTNLTLKTKYRLPSSESLLLGHNLNEVKMVIFAQSEIPVY